MHFLTLPFLAPRSAPALRSSRLRCSPSTLAALLPGPPSTTGYQHSTTHPRARAKPSARAQRAVQEDVRDNPSPPPRCHNPIPTFRARLPGPREGSTSDGFPSPLLGHSALASASPTAALPSRHSHLSDPLFSAWTTRPHTTHAAELEPGAQEAGPTLPPSLSEHKLGVGGGDHLDSSWRPHADNADVAQRRLRPGECAPAQGTRDSAGEGTHAAPSSPGGSLSTREVQTTGLLHVILKL